MNNLYHSFSVTFNWWFILFPIQIVIMAIFGSFNCWMTAERKIVSRDKNNFLSSVCSVIMAGILMVLVVKESMTGLIQLFDNGLAPDDNPAWSIFFAAIAVAIFAIVAYYILLYAAKIGKKLKRVYLIEVRRKNRKH